MTDIATAKLVKVKRHPGGVWDLQVLCPHCGKIHFHGGGSGENAADYLGHRVAHCLNRDNPGYEIVDPDQLIK